MDDTQGSIVPALVETRKRTPKNPLHPNFREPLF
jgi:hypothetical protein